jgi:hypothetical protein
MPCGLPAQQDVTMFPSSKKRVFERLDKGHDRVHFRHPRYRPQGAEPLKVQLVPCATEIVGNQSWVRLQGVLN